MRGPTIHQVGQWLWEFQGGCKFLGNRSLRPVGDVGVLSAGPKGHSHLPVKQGVVQDNDTSLSSSAMLPPTFQAPGPAEPDPVLLGVTSAAGGGGVQLPGGGRGGRGLARPWSTEPSPAQVPDPGFCCPSPSRTELLPTPRATSQRTLVPGWASAPAPD